MSKVVSMVVFWNKPRQESKESEKSMPKHVVKFGLEDFVQGGLVNDVDVTFKNPRFGWTPPNYGEVLCAFFADLEQEDGTVTEQFWSCGGKGTDLEPSEDGKRLLSDTNTTLKKDSNFYHLLEAFSKKGVNVKAGLEDISAFDGIRAHIVRVPQKRVNPATGKPYEVLLPTEILSSKGTGGKAPAAGKPAPAAATAPAEASGDVHEAALATLAGIIEKMAPESSMTINAVKLKATTALLGGPYKALRTQVLPLITNPEWLEENAVTHGAVLDGDKITRVPAE